MSMPEFGELSPQEMQSLQQIRLKDDDVVLMPEPPLITTDTIRSVLDDYNLGINRSKVNDIWIRGIDIAQAYLTRVRSSDDKTLGELYSSWCEEYFDNDYGSMNNAAFGIGFMFHAFAKQLGPGFVARFKLAASSEMEGAITQSLMVNGEKLKYDYRRNIFKKTKYETTLPLYQVDLTDGLEILKGQTNCATCLEDGALSAYNTISTVWDTLSSVEKPNETLLSKPDQTEV